LLPTFDGFPFVCHQIEEEVSGYFTFLIKNEINTSEEKLVSQENIIFSLTDSFGLDFSEAIKYSETFSTLISDDHRYF
jgi:hypothetical protein